MLEFGSYKVESVGKLVKDSKKRHIWSFYNHNESYVFIVTDSIMSNKLRVFIHRKKLYDDKIKEQAKKYGLDFQYQDMTIKVKKIHDSRFDLFINLNRFEPNKTINQSDSSKYGKGIKKDSIVSSKVRLKRDSKSDMFKSDFGALNFKSDKNMGINRSQTYKNKPITTKKVERNFDDIVMFTNNDDDSSDDDFESFGQKGGRNREEKETKDAFLDFGGGDFGSKNNQGFSGMKEKKKDFLDFGEGFGSKKSKKKDDFLDFGGNAFGNQQKKSDDFGFGNPGSQKKSDDFGFDNSASKKPVKQFNFNFGKPGNSNSKKQEGFGGFSGFGSKVKKTKPPAKALDFNDNFLDFDEPTSQPKVQKQNRPAPVNIRQKQSTGNRTNSNSDAFSPFDMNWGQQKKQAPAQKKPISQSNFDNFNFNNPFEDKQTKSIPVQKKKATFDFDFGGMNQATPEPVPPQPTQQVIAPVVHQEPVQQVQRQEVRQQPAFDFNNAPQVEVQQQRQQPQTMLNQNPYDTPEEQKVTPQPVHQQPNYDFNTPVQTQDQGYNLNQVPQNQVQQQPSYEFNQPVQKQPSYDFNQPVQQQPSYEMNQPVQQQPSYEMNQPDLCVLHLHHKNCASLLLLCDSHPSS